MKEYRQFNKDVLREQDKIRKRKYRAKLKELK